MKLDNLKLLITSHAHKQYCDRVEQIDKNGLKKLIREQMSTHQCRRKAEFLHLADVWWVFNIYKGHMIFITCFGKSTFDLPHAMKWARHQNDRIYLGKQKG